MTKLLKKYLQYAHAGPAEQKHILESIPAKKAHYHDGKPETVRELLLSTAIESTTLVQTEMYNTVLEGAEPFKCMREAIPIFRTTAGTLRVPKGETGTYASIVAEGAEIPNLDQDYGSTDFTIYKYGVRPLITQEMVDRGLYDVIELEARKAGMRIENALNTESMSVILENTGNSADVGNTSATTATLLANVAKAIGENQTDGFMGDTLILHPACYGSILGAFTGLAATSVGETAVRAGQIPTLLGMRVFVCSVTDTSSTYTWGWGVDGYVGGMVLDSRNAGAIAMERDIYVDRYQDPIRDLVGLSVKARFGYNYLHANASCRIVD